ncbi:MAG: hypothetical protein WA830_11815 [Candidatus Sulfotelmatobacter sp.]
MAPSQPIRSEERLQTTGLAAAFALQEKTMSIIDKALEANRSYAKNYDPTVGKHPAPKLAVVTRMDPRLSDHLGILGLPQADIDVVRTGGLAVTEDVLAELIVSNRVLEPQRYCFSTTPAAGSRHSQMTT